MPFPSSKHVKRQNSIYVHPKGLCWISVCILQLLLVVTQTQFTYAADEIRIGGLFETLDSNEEIAFREAINNVNKDESLLPQTRLSAQIEHVPHDDSFRVARKACSVIKSGIGAMFGPQSGKASGHVESICAALRIPHFLNTWNTTGEQYSLNLYPHISTISKAYTEVLKSLGWKKFCIIYENDNGLIRVQELIKDKHFDVSLRQLPLTGDYRPMLEEAREDGVTHIVLDVESENIFTVLKQAQQVGMMTDYHHYFITSLDLHTVDLEDFRHGGTIILALQLVDLLNPVLKNNLKIKMQTEVALMYDAVFILAKALDDLEQSIQINITSLDCDGDTTWPGGVSLINYIKLAQIRGLTGLIRFDSEGIRRDVNLDVLKLTKYGLKQIGSWDQIMGVIHLEEDKKHLKPDIEEILKNKTLIVTAALNEPYIMLSEYSEFSGNDRYEGFCIDLMYEIARIVGFKFTVVLSPDGAYGRRDSETNQWSGMIGELINHRADVAITDLTITHERQQVVDFTKQWMGTGISLLYKKPIWVAPSSYSIIFSPFSIEVWLYIFLAYLGVSLLLFGLARLSPYERVANPSILEDSSSKIEKQFSLDSSLFFSMGSFLQQKTDQQPRAASTRILALMWWFFILVVICSYTANLAALFIKVELGGRLRSPIESVEDLFHQNWIKYGLHYGGATSKFFESSKIATYQRLHNVMESQSPSVYTESNMEGVERVIKDDGMYAFFMESITIDYILERRCELAQVGGLLDSKGYGFALPQGSPYLKLINGAILQLQQDGILNKLKQKWWYQKRGGGKCKRHHASDSSNKDPPFSELGLYSVSGLFEILLIGMALATVVAIAEFTWNHFKSRKHSI